MINSFWWGGGVNNKGIKWLSWDRMTSSKASGGMGFRDLRSFNLAMIAKQGWNIMMKPHSLVAQIYKARYFPKSTLFDAPLGHNPSYAWRGIWKSRHILMNGCRWIVGNGANIKVMNDSWLRERNNSWVQSPQIQGVHNLTVNELMLPNSREWDYDKITSLFPPSVANCIFDIPLVDDFEEDKLIWQDSVDGQYKVRSGYKLLVNATGSGLHEDSQVGWNYLWKIHAPPKTKHLLWRICKNCLPTRSRLQEKCVECPMECPLCDGDIEDDWHLIVTCPSTVEARRSAGLEELLIERVPRYTSAADLILDICRTADCDIAGRFATLVWFLWQNRNNKVWQNEQECGRRLGINAQRCWFEWVQLQNFQQHNAARHAQVQQQERWQKPPAGWFKCNTDAAFHDDSNRTSAGWILRNYTGNFVMAGAAWYQGKYSIIEGEAKALLEAMRTMEQNGFSHVIFETDSKNVVDAIHNLRSGISEFSSIISHIRNVLSLNQNFVVKFVRRQANMVAHNLARAAIVWASRYVFDVLPLCITPLVNNEMI
jgi:ribonuclease HI